MRKSLIAFEEVLNLNTVIYKFFCEQFSVLKVFIKHFLHLFVVYNFLSYSSDVPHFQIVQEPSVRLKRIGYQIILFLDIVVAFVVLTHLTNEVNDVFDMLGGLIFVSI